MAKKQTKKVEKKKEDHTKIVSILSYLIVGIVWYFVDDEVQNDMTKFHVKQGLVLWVTYIIFAIIASLLFFISKLLMAAVQVAMIVWIIIGIIEAINQKKQELPLIGKFAKKFKF